MVETIYDNNEGKIIELISKNVDLIINLQKRIKEHDEFLLGLAQINRLLLDEIMELKSIILASETIN